MAGLMQTGTSHLQSGVWETVSMTSESCDLKRQEMSLKVGLAEVAQLGLNQTDEDAEVAEGQMSEISAD